LNSVEFDAPTLTTLPDATMAPNVLITGASGFLGTYLAQACREQGYVLYGVDPNPPYDPEQWERFATAPVAVVNFPEFLSGVNIDICFHLAGSASVPFSMSHPFEDFQKLLPGTAHLLEYIALRQPMCHFVLFSSAAVYGNPVRLPVREDDPSTPISPYGCHKYLAEQMVRDYSRIFKLTGSILRIFSAYGVGLRKQLFWDVLSRHYAASPAERSRLTLLGTGQESRDFVHARDVALSALCAAANPLPQSVQVLNVSGGREVRIADAVALLMVSQHPEIEICFAGQSRVGDPSRWVADISNLLALGYTPSVKLESGLAEYHSWFQQFI
jgi:UDP-glucose 4-epimerase